MKAFFKLQLKPKNIQVVCVNGVYYPLDVYILHEKIKEGAERQRPHQRDFAPVDVELSSELLVTADDRLHLLTAAQLVLRTLHLTQA